MGNPDRDITANDQVMETCSVQMIFTFIGDWDGGLAFWNQPSYFME